MSEQDRQRWDEKWSSRSEESFQPHPLVAKLGDQLARGELALRRGQALDLACGRGQNAFVLAELGFQVTALDISQVALDLAHDEAQKRGLKSRVHFQRVDLDHYSLPAESYDLICVTRFLDRRLLTEIPESIKPGGVVLYATRHMGALAVFPEAKVDYLLLAGELLQRFKGWKILHYSEGEVEAEILAQKPAVE